MNIQNIFNFKGINYWHLANCVGLNFIWTGGTMVITLYFLERSPDAALILQLGIMVSVFLGSFGAGWLAGYNVNK